MTNYELLGGIKLQQREDFEAAVFYTCPTCSATITVTADSDALIDHMKWHGEQTTDDTERRQHRDRKALYPTTRAELVLTARDLYDGYKESGRALDSDLRKSAFHWADLITEATIEDEDYTTLRASIIKEIEDAHA